MAETVSYICKPYFTCSSDFMSGVQTMCLLTSPKSSALPPPFPAAFTMIASSRTCSAQHLCRLLGVDSSKWQSAQFQGMEPGVT